VTDVHLTEELSAFLDGELSDTERSRAADHLADCPQCQQRLDELRELEALAQTVPRELTPPSDIATRVRARLERKRTPARPWWWAAAAAAVLAFVPWMIFRQQSAARMSTPSVHEEAEPRKSDTPESKVQSQTKPAVPAPPPPAFQSNGKKRYAEAPPADKDARLKNGERDEAERLDVAPKSVTGGQASAEVQTAPMEQPPAAAAAPEPERRRQNAPSAVAKGEAGAGAPHNETYDSSIASSDDVASYRWLRTARIRNGEDARRVRDEWLRVFARAGGRPHGEPALLAAIEAAAAAFGYDRRPDDRARLRNLAATYLSRPKPAAAEHVRQLVAEADAVKAP
jgi:hypothetical protein